MKTAVTGPVLIVAILAIWIVKLEQLVVGETRKPSTIHKLTILTLFTCTIMLIEDPRVNVSVVGANVTNNGYIAFDMIGDRTDQDRTVICHTKLIACCHIDVVTLTNRNGTALGNWFFPNGSTVLSFSASGGEAAAPFFASNRGRSVVRLYRVNNEMVYPSQRGRFCCVVPDTSGINRTHCVNICMFLYIVN